MLKRYTTERVNEVWKTRTKFETYLKVEIAAAKAWMEEGVIPSEDYEAIKNNAKVNIDRLNEIEKETKHDVIAFTRAVSETLGPEKKWVHYGLTSTDVVDTAYSVQLKKVNSYILENLENFANVLKDKAMEHKYTPVIGRTHGVHAEITSLGLKFALWYDEMKRNIDRFKHSSRQIEVGKISGAVGNFANTPIHIQDKICDELGLLSSKISTQTLQRDRHAEYISTIAIIGTTLEKIAIEIRHSQRTEVREMFEYFDKGQKGSSAMPHKRNPIASENITGIARVLRGYLTPAMENNSLWYERDISHSSVERVILPDATNLLDYALTRFGKVVENLIIDKDQMMNNINLTQGVVYSQRVLTELINKGLSREGAYDTVQPLALKAWEEKTKFIDLLKSNETITSKLSNEEIDKLFDPNFFLKEIDNIYNRVFE